MTAENWCIVTPANGSGNGTVSISAPVSEEKSARSVDLLVKAGTVQKTVIVIQEAATWVKVYLQSTVGIGTVSNAVSGTDVFDQIVGNPVRLTATVLTGYTFDGWYVNGTKVGSTAVFDYVVAGGLTLTAKAKPITYTVTVQADPGISSVSGGGNYSYGSVVTVRAWVYSDYVFNCWLKDNSWVSASQDYAFTVTGNTTLRASAYYLGSEEPDTEEPTPEPTTTTQYPTTTTPYPITTTPEPNTNDRKPK